MMAQTNAINKDSLYNIEGLANFGEHGNEVVSNNIYQIIDMELRDMFGEVRQTISRTVLYPNKTTRGHMHQNANESYYFINGNGLILLQGEQLNKLFRIQPETWIFIPKKTFHMVINTSNNEDLEFLSIYPGKSDRPTFNNQEQEQGKNKK